VYSSTVAGRFYEYGSYLQPRLQASPPIRGAGKILLRQDFQGGGNQVNPDLRNLIALQDIELKIASLQKEASDIPNKIQSFEAELHRGKAAFDESVAHTKELANRKRTFEGQVDLLRTKLSRLRDQLMAVKTNKEYTAMLHEIQAAEEQIRGEEDKILDVMEETEGKEKDLKVAEQAMLKRSAELKESIRKTNESLPSLETELSRLQNEKAQMESQVEAALLARYRRIAEARKGVALAEAKDELCSACHVRIRPQMYAELLRTENIHACDSCSRILFSRENL
jgi:uncharacterized protein